MSVSIPVSPRSPVSRSHRYTCEQCGVKQAIAYCYRCAEDDDPFVYCKECLDFAHHGRKRCYHQEEPIASHDKLMAKFRSSVLDVQRNISKYNDQLQEEKALFTLSATNLEVKVHEVFDTLRSLLDTREVEVIAHLWAMRDKRLLEFERKEVSFNKVKACIEDEIELAQDNIEDLLTSSKPHLQDEVLGKVMKKLDEGSSSVDRFFAISSMRPQFTGSLSFVPSIVNIRDMVGKYILPSKREWDEGDVIGDGLICNAKTLVVKSNQFWVGQIMDQHTHLDMCHISESLKEIKLSKTKELQTNGNDIATNALVCAYYEHDASWHRGLIERTFEKRGRKMATVRFLDYGNVEDISIDTISLLPPQFTEYPYQFHLCYFPESIAFTDREVRWKFNDEVKGRRLTVKILKRTYTCGSPLPEFCVGLCNEEGSDIAQLLLQFSQRKSAKSQEDHSIAYRDVRYRNSSKTASPQPPSCIGDSPNNEPSKQESALANNTQSSDDKNTNESESYEKPKESPSVQQKISEVENVDKMADEAKKGMLSEEKGVSPEEKGVSPEKKVVSPEKKGVSSEETGVSPEENGEKIGVSTEEKDISVEVKSVSTKEKLSVEKKEENSMSVEEKCVPTEEKLSIEEKIISVGEKDVSTEEKLSIEEKSVSVEEKGNEKHLANSNRVLDDDVLDKLSDNGVSKAVSSPWGLTPLTSTVVSPTHPVTPDAIYVPSSDNGNIPLTVPEEEPVPAHSQEPPLMSVHPSNEQKSVASRDLTLVLDSVDLSIRKHGETDNTEIVPVIQTDYVPPCHPILFEGASLALLVNSSLSSEDGCYWAQLVLEEKQQLLYENLSHELQSYANSGCTFADVSFVAGDFCMALYSFDSLWYRGKIEECFEDTVFVRFMDFGNGELLGLSNVIPLMNKFRQLPFQAVKCSLSPRNKQSLTDKECERFDECLSNNNSISATVLSFDDKVVIVDAMLAETGINLLTTIVAKADAFDMPSSDLTRWAMDKENIPKSDNVITSTPISDFIGEEPLPVPDCGHAKTGKSTAVLSDDPLNSSCSSNNSHCSLGRLSVDKSSLVKHLHISPVIGDGGDQEKRLLDEERASPSRSSESVDDGLSGKKKGTLCMRKWGSDRDISTTGERSLTRSSKRKGSKKKKSDYFNSTVKVTGLRDIQTWEVRSLFRRYGRVYNITKLSHSAYKIEMEKHGATKARDALDGTKFDKRDYSSMNVVIFQD